MANVGQVSGLSFTIAGRKPAPRCRHNLGGESEGPGGFAVLRGCQPRKPRPVPRVWNFGSVPRPKNAYFRNTFPRTRFHPWNRAQSQGHSPGDVELKRRFKFITYVYPFYSFCKRRFHPRRARAQKKKLFIFLFLRGLTNPRRCGTLHLLSRGNLSKKNVRFNSTTLFQTPCFKGVLFICVLGMCTHLIVSLFHVVDSICFIFSSFSRSKNVSKKLDSVLLCFLN